MPAPLLTSWTFCFTDARGVPVFQTTVDTPTKLGAEHAERCARCDVLSRPWVKARWDGSPGILKGQESTAKHRRAVRHSLSKALQELHRNGSRHPKAGTINAVPVEA